MPLNKGYSPAVSELNVPAVCEVVVDSLQEGRYKSLGCTAPLEKIGCCTGSSTSSGSLISTVSDKVSESDLDVKRPVKKLPGNEGWLITLIQVVGPFLVAGFGSMCTGILLDVVKDWNNFRMIDALMTLVPTLLGLKGNLEMTVTARLCTASNLGRLDDSKVLLMFLRDDLLLTQFQATIVSLLASILTLGIQAVKDPSSVTVASSLVVISSAVVTAAVACLFLGLLMTGVVVASRKLRINPDNVAAPLASSLGDISTLGLFAYISLGMHTVMDTIGVPIVLTCCLMVLCPIWGYLACRNPDVRAHLQQGWLPILLAMCISLGAGYILDAAATDLTAAPAYVPVVSGICGNILVILICRMTTVLRQKSVLGNDNGIVPAIRSDNPFWCGTHNFSSLTATFQLLLLLPVLAHVIFLPIISYFTQEVSITVVYLVTFLSLVFVHGFIMLFVTRELVLQLWRFGIDPDVAAIPILTAVADLTGGAFTCAIFIILYQLQDPSIAKSLSTSELTTTFVDVLNATTSQRY